MELNSVGVCGLALVLAAAIYAANVAVSRGDRLPRGVAVPTATGGTRTLPLTRRVGREAPRTGVLVWRYEQRGYNDGVDTSTYWLGVDAGGERLHARPVSYEVHRIAVVGARVTLSEDWRGRVTGLTFEPSAGGYPANLPLNPASVARVLGCPVDWHTTPGLLSGLGVPAPEIMGSFLPTGAFADRRGLADNQVELTVVTSGSQLTAVIGARQGTPPQWAPGTRSAPPVPVDVAGEFRGTLLIVRQEGMTAVLRVVRHGYADPAAAIDLARGLSARPA